MTLYCGVDGGGTRTRAVLIDENGAFVGYGASGSFNPKAVGLDGTAFSVCEALERAFLKAGKTDKAKLFIGLAGVRTEADRKAVHDAMRKPFERIGLGNAEVQFGHDLDVAHAAALGGRPGIVLVVGTGSAAFGRDAEGKTQQAGGWGWYIDDPGSGYWLGYQAMRAAARSCDGRGPQTLLEERVRSFLRIKTLHEMPNIIYNPHFSRERVAELAPVIFEAADEGDDSAKVILDDGFNELALMVSTVAKRLAMPQAPVSAVGGITHRGTDFDRRFAAVLHEQLPDAEIIRAKTTPVIGAAILALREDNRTLSDAAIESIQSEVAKAAATPPKINLAG